MAISRSIIKMVFCFVFCLLLLLLLLFLTCSSEKQKNLGKNVCFVNKIQEVRGRVREKREGGK